MISFVLYCKIILKEYLFLTTDVTYWEGSILITIVLLQVPYYHLINNERKRKNQNQYLS